MNFEDISSFVSRGLIDGTIQYNETVRPGLEKIRLPTISALRAKPGFMSFQLFPGFSSQKQFSKPPAGSVFIRPGFSFSISFPADLVLSLESWMDPFLACVEKSLLRLDVV
jgi:hypothetical protein